MTAEPAGEPARLTLPAPPSPRVSVVVPAAARPDLLYACLRSLARNGPREIPFETLVVTNTAESAAEALLRDSVTGVRVVGSAVPLGVAGACNRGRAQARGEYLVLLHDDAEVEPGWLEALVEAADRHPEAGAVGGKVLFPDGRLQNAGMILWRDGTTSPPWLGAPPPATAFDRPRAVDYCGTSSLLVRAASWDAVGGLDERFFPTYYVDVDLGMALRQRGQVVWYEPRSVIRHHQGASGGDLRYRLFVTRRNRELFLAKWGSAMGRQEPPIAGSAAAIERALTRAEAGAGDRQSPPAADVFLAASSRPGIDPSLEERQYLERNLALQRSYVDHLTAALAEAAAEAERQRENRAKELAELRARAATLAEIERGRWWRLYQWILPLLRRLQR